MDRQTNGETGRLTYSRTRSGVSINSLVEEATCKLLHRCQFFITYFRNQSSNQSELFYQQSYLKVRLHPDVT